MKKIIFLFLLLSLTSNAQNKAEINELKNIISSSKKPEEKIDSYKGLIEIYFDSDPSVSLKYINELRNLNKNNSCLNCEAIADFEMGCYYRVINDVTNSVKLFEIASSKSLAAKNYYMYQLSKSYKIHNLFELNELETAERELEDCFSVTKKLKLKTGYAELYYIKGMLNEKKSYHNQAIESYLKSYQLTDGKADNTGLRLTVLAQISVVYKKLKNYNKALQYNQQAILESQQAKDEFEENVNLLNRGILESDFKNYTKALPYLLKAEKFFTTNQIPIYLDSCNEALGITYFNLNQNSKSMSYLIKSLTSAEKANDISSWGISLLYISKINIESNNLAEAKKNIDKAKSLIKEKIESPLYVSVLETEINYYKKEGNYAKAIETLTLKDSIKELLNKKTNLTSLNEAETKYQTQQKEQQIKLLSTQNELAQKQKYIYIGLLGLLALIGGSLFYAYRNKIKTAQKLNELNELKSRFFANISHEFRTPLTLIKSPVQSLQSKIADENQLKELNLIDTNSTRMLQLVDQLLELSKIDSGNLKLILKDGNISSFLTSIIEPFQFQSKENGIHFTSNIQKTTENNAFDKDVIEKIVTNLVSNAFKYTPENESIAFTSSVENATLKLVVSNTGSDVKKEDVPKLFERFYQKNETQQGVGIGLALVKELIDLYKGTITTSVENSVLSFVVNIPLAVANENAVVIPAKVSSPISENSIGKETELPILLLVDDNAEIRSILKEIFKNDYQILEAQDGEEALQLSQKQIPDCIISDVMMPKMDGFEFTKQIKNNELTSFIPVVLLTAKTSDEAHLEGLKSTADAFLTKPFNNEIVKATVKQLIAERKKLHARYSQELVLRPVDIVINSAEEKFIERLQAILDKNLSNSEYTAEDFATEIGMSRMQLHRKLKSLLGVSATEFLRNERLKVGAELLKQGNGNISEIAYSVGFSDVSYFSKCFKEMYQCTPTEYVNWK